jgi:BlaI family penicillinase repressor
MTKEDAIRLGDLQLRIMKVLWRLGRATVAEVHQQLEGDPLAYTTVATMLRKMEDRGLVSHEEEARRFIYLPVVSSDSVARSMTDDFLNRFFEGSLASAVDHLLQARDVSASELAELEKLIRKRGKRR